MFGNYTTRIIGFVETAQSPVTNRPNQSVPIVMRHVTAVKTFQWSCNDPQRSKNNVRPTLILQITGSTRSVRADSASVCESEVGFRTRLCCRGEEPITRLNAVLKALSD